MADRSESFGEQVRKARDVLNISLRALAKRAGIHPTYLSKIELGHVAPPSADVQERITKALHAAGSDLVQERKEKLAKEEEAIRGLELELLATIARRLLLDPATSDQAHALLQEVLNEKKAR